MSTINEETTVADDTRVVAKGASAPAVPPLNGDTPALVGQGTPTTDGADDGELERELQQMEDDAATLQKEGMISEKMNTTTARMKLRPVTTTSDRRTSM